MTKGKKSKTVEDVVEEIKEEGIEVKVDMVKAVNTEIKNLKDELDTNKDNQKKLEKESAALAKEEEEKSKKLAGMQELKPSGKPVHKGPLEKPALDVPKTMVDPQGRNWEIDADGNKLRRI